MRNIHLAIALAGLALLGAGGILGWQAQECLAITDFQTAPHDSGLVCPCPLTVLWVDVRGTIRGRPVHDRFSTCMCGFGPPAAHDAHVILTTAPPPART